MFNRASALVANGLFRNTRVMSDVTKLNKSRIVQEISQGEKPIGIASIEPTPASVQDPVQKHPIFRPITEKEYQQLLHHLEEGPRTSYS